ncbi:hypothetical protein BDV98DRAFT_272302 [Pterulicium gracile]|uniref:DUF202 domain-containing protein n=1 Tax=Pterulicium gracile TaxID=1884261 RepID=A0A5C3Q7Y0_9AGAR|nr:hypothetical protein BDV98DRAFT_272302 [Pterula gracilis]
MCTAGPSGSFAHRPSPPTSIPVTDVQEIRGNQPQALAICAGDGDCSQSNSRRSLVDSWWSERDRDELPHAQHPSLSKQATPQLPQPAVVACDHLTIERTFLAYMQTSLTLGAKPPIGVG